MKGLMSAVLGVTFAAATAFAQTTSVVPPPAPAPAPTTTPTTNQGTFATLSPGNQKIAQALYDAQVTSATGTTAPAKLTLDDIAAMKHSGQGWGQIFKQMKTQGLLQARNLGQVVSASHRPATTAPTTSTGYVSTGPVVSTASGRSHVEALGPRDHGEAPAARGDTPRAGSNSDAASVASSAGQGAAGMTGGGGRASYGGGYGHGGQK